MLQKLVQSKKNSPLIASYVAELIYAFRATDEQGIGKLLSLLSTCFDSATCNEKDLHSYRLVQYICISAIHEINLVY